MAEEHVWRIIPDPGPDRDIRASKITGASNVISLLGEDGAIVALINLDKTKAVFRLDHFVPSPK